MPVRRALVISGGADERPRDHAPDRVLSREDFTRDARRFVELLERDRLFVRGDLEDRVAGGVDDPLPRALVLLAELLDDFRPRRRLVAEHAATGPVHEWVDHVVREAVWVERKRLGGDDTHELPVARGRVLALRPFKESSRDRGRAGLRRAAFERLDVSQSEGLEVRQVKAPHGAGDVPECVRSRITVLGRVGQLARAHSIENDHADS